MSTLVVLSAETVDLDSDAKEEPDPFAGLSATRIVPAVPRAITADLDDDFPQCSEQRRHKCSRFNFKQELRGP
ncbi:hypothetical protein BDZ89DRAFT_1058595 [Hymenopellis radicata]|nr:hypothetical protein BDZ89DRAFT_1058595 [Hymenopellis radicata]